MTKWGMAINKTRCIGCQTCAFACKMENNVPSGLRWNRVLTEGCDVEDGALGTYPALSRAYLPIACQHCENPACEKRLSDKGHLQGRQGSCARLTMTSASAAVCAWLPARTTPACSTGTSRCVIQTSTTATKTCRSARRAWWRSAPCARSAPTAATSPCAWCAAPRRRASYGDLDDPDSEVSRAIRERGGYVLLEEQGTRPQVHYFD